MLCVCFMKLLSSVCYIQAARLGWSSFQFTLCFQTDICTRVHATSGMLNTFKFYTYFFVNNRCELFTVITDVSILTTIIFIVWL